MQILWWIATNSTLICFFVDQRYTQTTEEKILKTTTLRWIRWTKESKEWTQLKLYTQMKTSFKCQWAEASILRKEHSKTLWMDHLAEIFRICLLLEQWERVHNRLTLLQCRIICSLLATKNLSWKMNKLLISKVKMGKIKSRLSSVLPVVGWQ